MSEHIRIGGLLRCCTQTLAIERSNPEVPASEGDTIHCKYCREGEMIFRDGAWEWKR